MDIELARLQEMHPRLSADQALFLVAQAARGLERNGHATGVAISLELELVTHAGSLAWPAADLSLDPHDHHRITEDGAEAVALALAHLHRGWRVVRRMQREEHADWLLEQPGDGRGRRVALEVSGVDRGSIAGRLREKLKQVAQTTDVDQRWAGVVGFGEPQATLRSTKARRNGR